MRVIAAQTAGFCMGVRRAVDLALQAARDCGGPVWTWGPLIHNRQVTARLEAEGVRVVDAIPASGTVVIRAHGVTPQVLRSLQESGLRIIDATCPHVIASQRNIAAASASGLACVIAGDPDHPEVAGLAGHSLTPVTILRTLADAQAYPATEPFFLIAQTTFMRTLYDAMAELLRGRYRDCRVFDSICDATARRQEEARTLAEQTGALVVAGDPHSANTCRLTEVGREAGARVWQVEDADGLPAAEFAGLPEVGLTAGASTPDWIIAGVRQRLESFA